jgi:DivIVA domain-containing protein
MPLTPEDVQNKEFTTVRLREGYDMQEVDNFLDEVETELTRLLRENDELRATLSRATRDGGGVASAQPVATPPPAPEPEPEPEPEVEPSPAPAAPVASGPAPHEAAAKVLALAQRTADELVADARAEADSLVADARSRAEQLDADISMRSATLEKDARERADALEREARDRRTAMLQDLEGERSRLAAEVDSLKAFEREYRSRLKAYLEGQLRHLEAGPSAPASPDSAALGGAPAA